MLTTKIKFWVLMELNRNDNSGYELMQKIGELTGKKPSPGYIYPLLNDLLKAKFVSVRQKGRKKVYSLTKEGKSYIKISLEQHKATFDNLIKIMHPISDKKETKELSKLSQLFFKDKDLLLKDQDIHTELMETMFKLYSKNYNKKRKEVRKLFKEFIEKLKKIK